MRKFIKFLLVTTLGKLATTGLITALVVIYVSQVTHLHAAESKHFLWSVETPQNQVYFLGSIHVLSADDYPLPQVMTDALNQAVWYLN